MTDEAEHEKKDHKGHGHGKRHDEHGKHGHKGHGGCGHHHGGSAHNGDAVYALGIFGAGVYFWQRATTNQERAVSVLKAVVWPSFMVYEAFSALSGKPQSSHRILKLPGRG